MRCWLGLVCTVFNTFNCFEDFSLSAMIVYNISMALAGSIGIYLHFSQSEKRISLFLPFVCILEANINYYHYCHYLEGSFCPMGSWFNPLIPGNQEFSYLIAIFVLSSAV